jgi:GNAT superfamily N-acetyltransferase
MRLEMRGLLIRRPRQGEGARMSALYREAFGRRIPHRRLRPLFQVETSLVAVLEDQIVGLAVTTPADPSLDPMLGCLDPVDRRFLEPLRAELGRRAALTVLAPAGLAPVRTPSDQVFEALAVDRRFRRRGVGQSLASVQLQLARREGARQVFVHCVAGSGSRELYEGLGMVPLVHFERHYGDGTAMTLLYASLG